jgi:soluble lytic murein transglycosylase-like protein
MRSRQYYEERRFCMLAKSTRNLFHGPHVAKWRQWTRDLVTGLVLAASVIALALIAHDRYGDLVKGKVLAVLPFALFQSATAADAATESPKAEVLPVRADPNEGRYRALAEFLARRYRVSEDVTFDLVTFAHGAGHQIGLDPLLIIAVMAVESRFNPIAESVAGAKGLMQVIPKYHPEKLQEFGGEQSVFDPETNILVGSQILKEYLRRTGSMNAALQMYAGAANDGEDAYTVKVLNEKQRLQQVVNQSKRKTVRVAQVSPLGE